MFGAPAPTLGTGMFGATTTTQPFAATTTTPFAATSGGLFGQASQPTQPTSIFTNTTMSSAPGTTGFGTQPTGGLFGTAPKPAGMIFILSLLIEIRIWWL